MRHTWVSDWYWGQLSHWTDPKQVEMGNICNLRVKHLFAHKTSSTIIENLQLDVCWLEPLISQFPEIYYYSWHLWGKNPTKFDARWCFPEVQQVADTHNTTAAFLLDFYFCPLTNMRGNPFKRDFTWVLRRLVIRTPPWPKPKALEWNVWLSITYSAGPNRL